MFIAKGSLGYGWKKKVEAMPPEEYRSLRIKLDGALKLPESQEALVAMNEYGGDLGAASSAGILVNEHHVEALNEAGIDVTVTNIRGLHNAPGDVRNTIYQIAIPDIGVMVIRNVEYLFDADEYAINAALDRGWRILAVLPPRATDDGNNPTYVMGHTKDPNA